jgi:hypothetical protein
MDCKHKCKGVTKSGQPCKRFIETDYCFQHKPLDDCPICLEKEKGHKMSCCGNVVGVGCLKKWKMSSNPSCPLCRSTKEFPKPFGPPRPPRAPMAPRFSNIVDMMNGDNELMMLVRPDGRTLFIIRRR